MQRRVRFSETSPPCLPRSAVHSPAGRTPGDLLALARSPRASRRFRAHWRLHDTIGFIESVKRMRGPGLALAPAAMTGMNDQGCSGQTISDLPACTSAFHVQLHRGDARRFILPPGPTRRHRTGPWDGLGRRRAWIKPDVRLGSIASSAFSLTFSHARKRPQRGHCKTVASVASLTGIAKEPTERSIPAACGGLWTATQVGASSRASSGGFALVSGPPASGCALTDHAEGNFANGVRYLV